jgi:hypothetical protein
MSKTLLVVLSAALVPAGAFAIDGQVLVNQSTVMAQGGFPYMISTPGSYKLSGALTAPLNTNAVIVSVSNVTLDLNGFSVQCSTNGSGPSVTCIAASAAAPLHDVAVRNGRITASLVGSPPGLYSLSGINFSLAQGILEDLQVRLTADSLILNGSVVAAWGANSIIKGNIFAFNVSGVFAGCPSVVVNNVNAGSVLNASGSGCVVSANVGIL